MDSHRLRILRELGDRGSVSAVAEALQVTPSAVSQQLAALQAQARVPLTVKDGRRLSLTTVGKALAEAGVIVARAMARADDAVERFLTEDARPIRISAFHSAGVALFGRLLTARGPEDPELVFSDEDVAQSEFVRLTADHDLVIAHRLPQQPHWPTDRIAMLSLLREPMDIAMSAAHPLAKRRRLRPTDLRGQKWVAVHAGFPLRGVLEHISAAVGEPAHVVHEINEFSVAAEVIASSETIAIMPRLAASTLLPDRLALRPLHGLPLVRHIDVLSRPENAERSSVRRVLGLLRQVAAELRDDPTVQPS
ncbi:LysR family transcriptional regulator [Microbacterium sp. No. 7]|uniref:LysR family transcriptional regulator n=1 Tax=Microbacterium sp. No. 7 TaxID=1714373 RepID=UPI0006CF6878|nr:LysR family transcriptional regulator [Microbacterium sp. No. 7]ALJ20490.1 LysR family transcriptional regulator [Microbacterium sp. No. 7]